MRGGKSGVLDQAARIRPLLNLLKTTGPKYVEIGRNVALDEASVACRSKYGKPIIVYNPIKPTGKYHFRIYMLCCFELDIVEFSATLG